MVDGGRLVGRKLVLRVRKYNGDVVQEGAGVYIFT